MWSLDDSKLPGMRNISLNAEGYKYSYAKLKWLLEREPNVRRVYLGVGFHNFSSYYDDYIWGSSFKFFAHRYLAVLTPGDYWALFTSSPAEFLRMTKLNILNGLRPGLRGECELYGTFPTEKQSLVFNLQSTERRLQSQFFARGELLGTSESNTHYLDRIAELCAERGIDLKLLNTPVHAEYAARVPARFKQLLHDFVERRALDYYAFDDLTLPDSAFLPDGDHLNYAGAQLATAHFERTLQRAPLGATK
jgi:hypothetical protein